MFLKMKNVDKFYNFLENNMTNIVKNVKMMNVRENEG